MHNLHYWLALIRTPGLGPATIHSLVQRYGSPAQVLASAPRDLVGHPRVTKTIIDALKTPDWASVERDLAWATQPDRRIILIEDAEYPTLLKAIPSAPIALFVHGSIAALQTAQIAMVGSRNPSPGGRQAAADLARALVGHGFAITSGLALGIDAASHQGALDGGGCTIAVSATGPDQIYPRRHQKLADDIIAHDGVVLTEFPTGVPPAREHFPRRNRIISGMARGTLVVEAALKSGSLITAHYAMEQGREVFAVPGSIYNSNAAGCHALIKQGAKLTERADDIVEEFDFSFTADKSNDRPVQRNHIKDDDLQREQNMVLFAIGFEPTAVDTVIERTGMTADRVTSILVELEIQGRIAHMISGDYMRLEGKGAP